MELLRHHDYYSGWLDCIVNTEQKKYLQDIGDFDAPHLFDINSTVNPENAGLNAGALFTFAALCKDLKTRVEHTSQQQGLEHGAFENGTRNH